MPIAYCLLPLPVADCPRRHSPQEQGGYLPSDSSAASPVITNCFSDCSSSGCRRLLREEVTSGRLDQATSKAAVLQQLCDRLKFNPEAAGSLHRSLYRQKMDDVLKNHQKITGALLFVCCFPDERARHTDMLLGRGMWHTGQMCTTGQGCWYMSSDC